MLRRGDELEEKHFVFRNPGDVDKVREFVARDFDGAALDKIVLDIGRVRADADGTVEDATVTRLQISRISGGFRQPSRWRR